MKNIFQENDFVAAMIAAGIYPAYGEGDGGEGDGGDGGDGGDDGGGDGGDGGDGGEGDGKGLSDKEAELLKENMKKKEKLKEATSQLESLRGEHDTIKSELTTLKEAIGDLDVDSIKDLIAKNAEAAAEADKAKKEQLKAQGKWDELEASLAARHESERNQIIEQHKSTLAERESEIASLKEQLSKQASNIEELAVGRSFSDSSLISEKTVMSPNIARSLFGANIDVIDGQPVAFDKPRGDDTRARLLDGDGKPLSFDDAMKRLIDSHPDKDRLWKAEGSQGAGSGGKGGKGGDGGNGGGDGDKKLSGQEKISQGLGKLLNKS